MKIFINAKTDEVCGSVAAALESLDAEFVF